jgi:hypothetical protein|nr:MAG TPA: hypothetical protein [Caudoviricetes sp.]
MIIIKNSWFPFGDYSTCNVLGFILFTKSDALSPRTLRHERIHSRQILETFVIGFYLWYALEYLIIRLFHRKQEDAYYDVSFEEEAYANQDDVNYLEKRKVFSYGWIKYVRINSRKKTV